MAAWAKPDAEVVTKAYAFLVKKEAVYTLFIHNGVAGFNIGNPSETWHDSAGSTSLKADTWYHLAGTFDGKVIKVYVNGEEDGSTEWAGTIDVTDWPAALGANPHNSVGVRDVALTASEIKKLMNNGLKSLLSVSPAGKLSVLWGKIKMGCE